MCIIILSPGNPFSSHHNFPQTIVKTVLYSIKLSSNNLKVNQNFYLILLYQIKQNF